MTVYDNRQALQLTGPCAGRLAPPRQALAKLERRFMWPWGSIFRIFEILIKIQPSGSVTTSANIEYWKVLRSEPHHIGLKSSWGAIQAPWAPGVAGVWSEVEKFTFLIRI